MPSSMVHPQILAVYFPSVQVIARYNGIQANVMKLFTGFPYFICS